MPLIHIPQDRAGVRVMAIGITRAVDEQRLFNTVSQPVEENYLHADNFAGLSSLIGQVLTDLCQVPSTTTSMQFPKAQIFFFVNCNRRH